MGFQESSLPSKYLGALLVESIVRKGSWMKLLDKMRKCLSNWTYRPLNLVSQLVLVKSIPQAIPVYLFDSMMGPKVVLKEI